MESTYDEALAVELTSRMIPFARQVRVPAYYKGHAVGEGRIDVLVENQIVVELKAVDALLPIHTAQVIAYLKAGCFPLGLLVNFNVPLLRDGIRRLILT